MSKFTLGNIWICLILILPPIDRKTWTKSNCNIRYSKNRYRNIILYISTTIRLFARRLVVLNVLMKLKNGSSRVIKLVIYCHYVSPTTADHKNTIKSLCKHFQKFHVISLPKEKRLVLEHETII